MRKRRLTFILMALLFGCRAVPAFAAGLNMYYEEMLRFETPEIGLAPVSIALIDTGIDPSRLAKDRIIQGENYVSETQGDLVGHGTRVASLLIGAGQDGDDISDLAPNATLVPLVYYSKFSSGVPINGGISKICQGIYDAVDKYKCRVIVISSGVTEPNTELERAVLYAEANNVIVISAVGNDGMERLYYPAAYPTVIGVGAVGEDKAPTRFSQKNGSVMISAPGEALYAVSLKNGMFFEKVSGTSYACAYAAALATQLAGEHPNITPLQFRWVLQNTSEDLETPGYDELTGAGLLQMEPARSHFPVLSNTTPLPFYDVFVRDWFYENVCYAYENNLFSGISETLFAPGEPMTRVMLVTVLHRAAGEPSAASGGFADVPADAYYAKAVAWAAENGIVKGYDESTCPDDTVTREQIAAILQRYAGFKGITTDESGILSRFTDADQISGWARENVEWAVGAGLISGKGDGILDPLGSATRAEVAAMLHRFLEKIS